MKARKLKVRINMDNDWMNHVYQLLEMSLGRFFKKFKCILLNNLPFLKIFITNFSETVKARKLTAYINMDNYWMYCVYRNTVPRVHNSWSSVPWYVFKKLKCILLNNFCLWSYFNEPHLVSKVRKLWWRNGCQGPITLGVMSLGRFSNFAILEYFCNRFLLNYEN